MTDTQTALLNHIRSLNEKTLAWVAEDKNRWACTIVEDLAHWAESGVHCVEDFIKYNLATEMYDGTKSVYGFRPNWSELMSFTIEELEECVAELRRETASYLEMTEREAAYEREELAHEEWLSSSYEDRYLAFAEAAGF